MNITYTGGNGQQVSLFKDALAHTRFPWDSLDVEIVVTWPEEPSLPGHKEAACTHSVGDVDHFSIEVRNGLDLSTAELRLEYMTYVAHELGHVIAFHTLNRPEPPPVPLATIVTWFRKLVSGDGWVDGTVGDMTAPALWEDKIQEGMAEVLKDALLPEEYRAYDNKSHWFLKQEHFSDFMGLFINQIEGGPGTEKVRVFTPPVDMPGWTGPAPVGGVGLRYIDERLGYLKQEDGYPRVRYSGSATGFGPVSGVVDFPTFWTPGEKGHDGRLLDVEHRQVIAYAGPQVNDLDVTVGVMAVITDPEGPPEGVPPDDYRSLFWNAALFEFAGWVQVSQFLPDPTGTIPPWPYTDPTVSAAARARATVRFKTRL